MMHASWRGAVACGALCGSLPAPDAIIFLLRRHYGVLHPRMCALLRRGCAFRRSWIQPLNMVASIAIRLRQCLRPAIPIVARSRNLGWGVNLATAAFYTGADAPLVHIQSDGIHDFHGDLLGVLNLLVPEFSFFCTKYSHSN